MGESGKRKLSQDEVPAPPSHCIITSDEVGLMKVTEVPSGDNWEETAAKQRWGQPSRQQGVARLQVHCPEWDPDRILVAAARSGGWVTLHRPTLSREAAASGVEVVGGSDGAVEVGSFRAAPPATTSGRADVAALELRGLRFTAAGEGLTALRLVTATAGGHLAVHGWEPGESEGEGCGGVVRRWQDRGPQGPVRGKWREALRMQTVKDVQDMDVGSCGRHVAVGGDGYQLKVWDLSTASSSSSSCGSAAPEPLFAGKGGKLSRSGLHDLAHVTTVAYVPGRDDQLVLVGTAKHKLWLYDMRAGRKPQSEVVWGEGRITVILPVGDGSRLWVGNGRGQVEAVDLRQAPTRMVVGHALKGSAGSIRSLSVHPSQPLIASVSLDRHLRVHSTTTRQLLAKVYLKQALTGVAWMPPPLKTDARAHSDDEGERHEDETTNIINGLGDSHNDGVTTAEGGPRKVGGRNNGGRGSVRGPIRLQGRGSSTTSIVKKKDGSSGGRAKEKSHKRRRHEVDK